MGSRGFHIVALLPLVLWPALAAAQSPKAGVVTAVQGQSVAVRKSVPQPVLLHLKDDVFVQDRIETKENALARILLGGKALVTIRELSVFTITEEPERAIVNLGTGKAALGVAKSLLKPGEAVEVRTPNAIAAVRGSSIVVEVEEVDGEVQTLIAALQVSVPVTVSFAANPGMVTALTSNHFMVVQRLGLATTSTPVAPLPPGLAARLAKVAEGPKALQHAAKLPDKAVNAMIEEAGKLAESMGAASEAGPDPSTSRLGVQENPCRVATAACAPAAPPTEPPPPVVPGAPRAAPPPGAPPPVVVVPPTPPSAAPPPPPVVVNPPPGHGGTPPGQQNTPPGHGGTAPGQSPPSAFVPPGHGGATPFTPGHGGTPPGQRR